MLINSQQVLNIAGNISLFSVPAMITSSLQNSSVLLNTSLSLNCSSTGHPTPKVFWTKDGSQHIPRATLTNANQTLTVSQTVLDDSGLYECYASNRAGHDTSKTWVQITGTVSTSTIV